MASHRSPPNSNFCYVVCGVLHRTCFTLHRNVALPVMHSSSCFVKFLGRTVPWCLAHCFFTVLLAIILDNQQWPYFFSLLNIHDLHNLIMLHSFAQCHADIIFSESRYIFLGIFSEHWEKWNSLHAVLAIVLLSISCVSSVSGVNFRFCKKPCSTLWLGGSVFSSGTKNVEIWVTVFSIWSRS